MKDRQSVIKNFYIKLALKIIARAVIIASVSDASEKDFSFSFGVLGTDMRVSLKRTNGVFSRCENSETAITLKNAAAAVKVLTGGIAPREAYAKNYFAISGDYALALEAMEAMERAEACLLPKCIAKKLFGVGLFDCPKMKFYGRLLFGRL